MPNGCTADAQGPAALATGPVSGPPAGPHPSAKLGLQLCTGQPPINGCFHAQLLLQGLELCTKAVLVLVLVKQCSGASAVQHICAVLQDRDSWPGVRHSRTAAIACIVCVLPGLIEHQEQALESMLSSNSGGGFHVLHYLQNVSGSSLVYRHGCASFSRRQCVLPQGPDASI